MEYSFHALDVPLQSEASLKVVLGIVYGFPKDNVFLKPAVFNGQKHIVFIYLTSGVFCSFRFFKLV